MLEPNLPTELVIIILSIAATHHRPTAARLCLVSKWVRDMVEPILYRVLVLKHARVADAHTSLYSTKFNTFVRCLGIFHGQVMDIRAHEKRPLSIRNFATDSGFYDDIIVSSDVEELHLFTRRPPGWEFPRLRRLHFCWQKFSLYIGGTPFPIHEILKHPQLTHIAFSLSEEPRMPSLIPTVIRLLKEHKPLLLLYVRLFPSSHVTGRRAIDYESLDGQLASIGDARLVVRHVSLKISSHSFLDEWEDNALRGESIWDWAQAQFHLTTQRSSGRLV